MLIPFIKIKISDILGIKELGNTLVVNQRVFNGVVIKYKKGSRIKERALSFFNIRKSREFMAALKRLGKV